MYIIVRRTSRTVWIVGAGGLAIVLVLGVLWYLSPKSADSNGMGVLAVEDSSALRQALAGSLSEEDSDNDGLRDWEEALWGTDPTLSDTDGDGTSDGEEVDAGRNPTIAGPDDTLEAEALKANASGNGGKNLNATDKFAQAFFTDYLSMRQSGQLNTDSGKAALVSQAAQLQTGQFTQDTYTQNDLRITTADDEATLRQYANVMGSIIERYSVKNRNEAVILLDALQTEDQDILNELTPVKEAYKNMHTATKDVIVPASLSSTHLHMVNSMARLEKIISAMQNINEDPVSAIAAISAYQQTAGELAVALSQASVLYDSREIFFSKTDPGYIFTHIAAPQ